MTWIPAHWPDACSRCTPQPTPQRQQTRQHLLLPTFQLLPFPLHGNRTYRPQYPTTWQLSKPLLTRWTGLCFWNPTQSSIPADTRSTGLTAKLDTAESRALFRLQYSATNCGGKRTPGYIHKHPLPRIRREICSNNVSVLGICNHVESISACESPTRVEIP
jgi:hypothetical protein